MQQCPKCNYEFKMVTIRHSKEFGEIETRGTAMYCPVCGVDMTSWAAHIGHAVVIDTGEEDFEAVLKAIDGDNAIVFSEMTGKEYTFDLDNVYLAA